MHHSQFRISSFQIDWVYKGVFLTIMSDMDQKINDREQTCCPVQKKPRLVQQIIMGRESIILKEQLSHN